MTVYTQKKWEKINGFRDKINGKIFCLYTIYNGMSIRLLIHRYVIHTLKTDFSFFPILVYSGTTIWFYMFHNLFLVPCSIYSYSMFIYSFPNPYIYFMLYLHYILLYTCLPQYKTSYHIYFFFFFHQINIVTLYATFPIDPHSD